MKLFQLFSVELRHRSCVAGGDKPLYQQLVVKLIGVDVNQLKTAQEGI